MTPRSRKPPAPVDDGLPDVGTEDVTLSNGKVFRLRGLTVGEMRDALTASESDEIDAKAAIVAACTVQPKITPARMAEWLKTAAVGDAHKMTNAAERLCAIDEGARKSRPTRNRNQSTTGE